MPSTERFERLSELFEHARLRPPNERAEFLETACADDAALRDEVLALLRFHEDGEDAIDHPVPRTPAVFEPLRASLVPEDGPLPDRSGPSRHTGPGTVAVVNLPSTARLPRGPGSG
jgi:hypothetical protein